jgi:two-component system autoinducer 1 sensor kinase/phosphatase LuxN
VPPDHPTRSTRSGKGVLLCIDDAVPVLEVLTFVLEECGYSVLVSPSARHGLTLFQAEPVDLVILDHEMLEMSGYEVALEMRRLKPAVPIIMNSGSAKVPADALNVVDAIVQKGTSYRPLVSKVDQQMAASQAASGHEANPAVRNSVRS